MPYWEYEYRLDEINKTVDRENKEQESESGGMNYNSVSKNADRMLNKSMSNIKMPSVPKI